MSQENVELVRNGYEAFARGDMDGLVNQFWAPEIEWRTVRGVPFEGTYRGAGEVFDALRDWTGTFDEFTTVVEEMIDAGDRVIACHRMQGKGKESGAAVDFKLVQIITIQDGKQVAIEDFSTRQAALEALGLAE
jgi:uncharacterized protein